MAGILDSKSRIIDYLLTDEGRRRLAEGSLQFKYASFSDANTFYEADVVSGSSDASTRIFLEAHSSISRDRFIPVTDDSGKLVSHDFDGGQLYITSDGSLFSSGSAVYGQQFSSLSLETVENIGEKFAELKLLSVNDTFDDDPGFEVSPENYTFTLTNKLPLDIKQDVTEASIDALESFILDPRMAHISNFKHLPPIDSITGEPLGTYQAFKTTGITQDDITQILATRESVDVTFPKTSKSGNTAVQIYEAANGKLTKLDILRYSDTLALDGRETYFVGKVYVDSTGNGNFVNQFILTFTRE